MAEALKTAGDVTQAVVVVAMTYGLVRVVVGFFAPMKHQRDIIGSAAAFSQQGGGTKTTPMQA